METEIVDHDFVNHLYKCRTCLKQFEIDDTQIKITAIVQLRFQELTQIQLKNTSENFSNVICETCNNELRRISGFRKDLIHKQKNLYELYDEKLEPEGYHEIKLEPEPEDTENFGMESVEYLDDVSTMFYGRDYSAEQQYSQEMFSVLDTPSTKSKKSKSPKKFYKRAMCGLCGNSYYKDQLQRHIDKVHYKLKRFFCDICGFGSFLKCNLSTHMAKHVAKEFREQILCSLCPATFTRHESLKNHMKTEHEENPEILKCFCGKEFNLRHKLTTHIKRTHNNARDHACDQCPKRFFTPKELKIHILKNHGPPGYKPPEFLCGMCGKKYSSQKSLRTHMKHHKAPEFNCDYENCNKGFISKLLLTNHQKIHLGQRDHQCDQCEKSFFSANHLRRHIAVTHEKVKVNCFIESCRFSVGRKDYLRNHIILSHRDLPEDVKNGFLLRIRDMKI